MAKKEPEKIRVSKLDAARRQLDCAIELWFADKDAVSIHTLAAAAHQIIHDINQKNDGEELIFNSIIIKHEYRSRFISLLKRPINFFKHADKDPEGILEFAPMSSIMFIMFSIKGLEALGETISDIEYAFFHWLKYRHPTLITTEYKKITEDQTPIDCLDKIRNMSKGEFFEAFMCARALLRGYHY